MKRIPIFLLTGFLGSGKSSLLSDTLQHPQFHDTAVIVNEFGEIGLDGMLVAHSEETLVTMTTGCLCCTIRGDVRQTLKHLLDRRDQGEIPAFSRVIIETTGLADPSPVIHTLLMDPVLAPLFSLVGVVTTVDLVNGRATLGNHEECIKQIAMADTIILTKGDLVEDKDRQKEVDVLRKEIARLNPAAKILDRHDPTISAAEIFKATGFDMDRKSSQVHDWLNAEAFNADEESHTHEHGHHHEHEHGHHHEYHDHHHDINRHGEDIHAFNLTIDEPISSSAFGLALDLLSAHQGENLLRLKGIVNLSDWPNRPVVIHGVQHIFHDPVWLNEWPTEDRRTKLVFITRGVTREAVDEFFRVWTSLDQKGPEAVGLMAQENRR